MPRSKAHRLYSDHLSLYRVKDFAEVAEELQGLDPTSFRLLLDAMSRQHTRCTGSGAKGDASA